MTRRIYDTLVGVIAIIVGGAGVFVTGSTSHIIELAFPDTVGVGLFAVVLVAGLAIMFGTKTNRAVSPGYVIAGLFLATGFFLAYGVAGIGSLGLKTLTATTPYFVLSAFNIFRIFEISRGAREARAAVVKRD